MNDLTKPQEDCLLAVERHLARHGHAPTRRELAALLDQKSTNGINQILEALKKKGRIRLDPPREKRNIVVLRPLAKQLSLIDERLES